MKNFIILLIFFVSNIYSQNNYDTLEVKIESNTNWWAGIIIEGH